jgi:hypothetical protein
MVLRDIFLLFLLNDVVRFVAWVTQMLPLLVAWPVEAIPPQPGIQILNVVAFIGGVLPNMYMVARIWIEGKKPI